MAVLGELEGAVMEILWSHRSALSVRDVHEKLWEQRDLAYTTVMTVLDRLSKKGVADRTLDGRAWLYSPAVTRVQLVRSKITELLDGLPADERAEVVAWAAAGAVAEPAPADGPAA